MNKLKDYELWDILALTILNLCLGFMIAMLLGVYLVDSITMNKIWVGVYWLIVAVFITIDIAFLVGANERNKKEVN